MSVIRQNYHTESEAALNKQINLFLYASMVYKSMASHFERDDVALLGFHKFFKKAEEREESNAQKLMEYQNKRGGNLLLQPIEKPERDSWGSGTEAMHAYLEIQKTANQSLLTVHELAVKHEDAQMADYIESDFLEEKVKHIKKVSDHLSTLKRLGSGFGEYMFDQETLGNDGD